MRTLIYKGIHSSGNFDLKLNIFETSSKEIYLYYFILQNDRVLERQKLVVTDNMYTTLLDVIRKFHSYADGQIS